jgi:hypothetical protein
MMAYEHETASKQNDSHDHYLTELIKAIRIDLQIKDESFPNIYFKKA